MKQNKMKPAFKSIKELQKMTNKELRTREERYRAELFAVRFQAALGNLDQTARVRLLRHQIARVLTVLQLRKVKGFVTENLLNRDEVAQVRKEAMDDVEGIAVANVKKQQARARASERNQTLSVPGGGLASEPNGGTAGMTPVADNETTLVPESGPALASPQQFSFPPKGKKTVQGNTSDASTKKN